MASFEDKPQYRPRDVYQAIAVLVEECGEVQAAAGKTLRWGIEGVNPELPPEQQETNAAWLLRELDDLEQIIALLRGELRPEGGGE